MCRFIVFYLLKFSNERKKRCRFRGVGKNLGRLGEGETVVRTYCIKKSIFKIIFLKARSETLEKQIPNFSSETL